MTDMCNNTVIVYQPFLVSDGRLELVWRPRAEAGVCPECGGAMAQVLNSDHTLVVHFCTKCYKITEIERIEEGYCQWLGMEEAEQ